VKTIVTGRRITGQLIAVVGVGLIAPACGCDSKQPSAENGSAATVAKVTTTGPAAAYPGVAPHSSVPGSSTFSLAPPMLAPVDDDLAAFEVSPEEAAAVQADARKLNDAFYAGDFETILRLRHPRFIDKAGGPEVVVEKLREELALINKRGVKVESFGPHARPIFLKSKIREYVFVPTRRILTNGTARVEQVSYQFGSREIGNPTWTYVDGQQLNNANINSLFPDFPARRQLLEVSGKDLTTRK
jgi:hypothetical protein